MVPFADLGLTTNASIFAAAAVAVWIGGWRLAGYVAKISDVTGLGHAVAGIALLAGITSLPEIAATATAAVGGNSNLAINNLFGSIALQVVMLVVVDFVAGRKALTSVIPEPMVMLEGSLNIVLLALAAAAMIVGDIAVFGAGLWSWSLLAAYIGCVWILSKAEGRRPWLAARDNKVDPAFVKREGHEAQKRDRTARLSPLVFKTVGIAAVILAAGYTLAKSGEAIAEISGLGQSFVGFVLLALATSLPELSTALSATSRGLVTMAISDILGTNLINVALVFLTDILDASAQPVLSRVGPFAIFGALLAIVVTALFQAGLAERRDKALFRLGYDSISVIFVYGVGLIFLYSLRNSS